MSQPYKSVQYQYHPSECTRDGRGAAHHRDNNGDNDERTLLDWLFLRPFRCKSHNAIGNHNQYISSSKFINIVDIASVFSRVNMPSAAELLCGSIDAALALEGMLAKAAGIMLSTTPQKQLSEVSFKVGYGPIIRYTNTTEQTTSTGTVSEEAFNTIKRICGFKDDDLSTQHIFTKQEVKCPIRNTLHHVELRRNGLAEEIVFRLGRQHASIECETIIQDTCHRFLASNVENKPFILLIVGPRMAGKSSVLRELKRTLSSSSGFHNWNVSDGNEVARHIATTEATVHCISSSVISCIKEVKANNTNKRKNRLPYVILFDDLSLEVGIPLATDMITKLGINVIASLGNSSCGGASESEYNLNGLAKVLAPQRHVDVMILEIKLDGDNHDRYSTNYKLTTLCT